MKREFIDPKAITEAENEANAEAGAAIAETIMMQMDGMPTMIAYNVLGTLVSRTFSIIEYAQPQHALEEFDHWVKFTRQHLAGIIKERMQ